MNRPDANKQPTVAPLLAAWQAAKAERDRLDLDGRVGPAKRKAAHARATVAERAYDAAVAPFLVGSK